MEALPELVPIAERTKRVYTLHRVTHLPVAREDVFAFFSRAENLERITPPELRFEFLTPLPIRMRPGVAIDYRIRLYGIAMRWRTRIREWYPPSVFIDEQEEGPYALWVHQHRFFPEGDGTRVEDWVRYRLPLGWLGRTAHPMVRRQLERIFDYRETQIRSLLVDGARIGEGG